MAALTTERWRKIPSCSGYEASSWGRIRRVVPRTSKKWGKTLATRRTNCDYHYLNISIAGKITTRHVHHLVAEAFLGPRPARLVVSHDDENKDNNQPDNLCHRTHSDNMRRAYRFGSAVAAHGENHVHAKLTAAQAVEIRRRSPHEDNTKLAKEFSVTRGTIWGIKTGRTWKGVA